MEEGVMKWITQEGGGTHTVEAYFRWRGAGNNAGVFRQNGNMPLLGELTVAHLEVEAHR